MLLEVIACSLEDALAAEAGGADRIELVRNLAAGGLTPSLDLVDAVLARVRIPVRVMVRDTISHFVCDPRDRSRLLATARELSERSVDGIVFGAVTHGVMTAGHESNASIVADIPLLTAVLRASGGKPATFHRAFESVTDPVRTLGELGRIRGGGAFRLRAKRYSGTSTELEERRRAAPPVGAVDRVLTNGGAGDWPTRLARLEEWTRACPPHVQFILGGGVTRELLDVLPGIPALREVHVGRAAREPASDDGLVMAHKVEAIATRLRAMSD
jgi:copper homeostasis protein